MVKISEITDFLKELAPLELAEDYDNVGLLADSENENVEKLLLTLDTDYNVAEEAKKIGAQMIVSHHPLIFNPLKNITSKSETGRTIRELIKSDIALFAMHTNFDSVKGGLCDFLAEKIFGKDNFTNFEGVEESGIGRVVKLKEEMLLGELCDKIKAALKIERLRIVGDEGKVIKKTAIVGGGGGSMTKDAALLGADVYISGDFKYQHGRDAHGAGLALIEITHYDAEIIFCEYMKKLLENKFGTRLSVVKSCANTNVWRTV